MRHTASSMTSWAIAGGLAITLLAASPTVPAAAAASAWTPQPPLLRARAGLTGATVDGQLLAIGGLDSTGQLPTVESRRLAGSDSWRAAPRLPTPRSNLGTAVLDGRVYAVGGMDASIHPLSVVEVFEPKAGRWTESRPLPQPRGATSAAALGGQLYVAGGVVPVGTGFGPTASMVVYDPARNTWRAAASMHTARERFRLVAAGGFLYAVGGLAGGPSLATVERYDPRTDSWTPINSMRQSRALPCVVETTIDGRPFLAAIAGGVFSDSGGFVEARRTTEVLDLTTGRWSLLGALLPPARLSQGCASPADGTILSFGGATPAAGGGFTFLADTDALSLTAQDVQP